MIGSDFMLHVFATTASALTLLLGGSKATTSTTHHGHTRTVGVGQIKFDRHGPEWWAARARAWHSAYTRTRRELLAKPTVREAIDLACATYGSCTSLWRKARCESGLYAFARNPSGASGLFQFLPSTFASTPYAGFSVFSPYANALAAGWMHRQGRGGEWVCQ